MTPAPSEWSMYTPAWALVEDGRAWSDCLVRDLVFDRTGGRARMKYLVENLAADEGHGPWPRLGGLTRCVELTGLRR